MNLRMPGQYFDSESDLFYNWNRYYNPEIGRYISSDPIGLEGGLNTFSYVEQSPLLYADPKGLVAPAIAACGASPFCRAAATAIAKEAVKRIPSAIKWCTNIISGEDEENEGELPQSKPKELGEEGGEIIEVDPKNLIPTEKPSGSRVKRYKKRLNNGEEPPPIKIVEVNGRKYIVDGHHRAAAARSAGKKIRAEIVTRPSDVIDDLIQDAGVIMDKKY